MTSQHAPYRSPAKASQGGRERRQDSGPPGIPDRRRPDGGAAQEHYCEVGSRTSSGSPNHRDAACATCASLKAASLAHATTPSGRTSTALKPSRSFVSLTTYAIRPLQRLASA